MPIFSRRRANEAALAHLLIFLRNLSKSPPFREKRTVVDGTSPPQVILIWGGWTNTMLLLGALATLSAALILGMPRVAVAQPHQFTGIASYYSLGYSGRTARGDKYDPTKFTAAHRTLPFGTRLRVTDPRS